MSGYGRFCRLHRSLRSWGRGILYRRSGRGRFGTWSGDLGFASANDLEAQNSSGMVGVGRWVCIICREAAMPHVQHVEEPRGGWRVSQRTGQGIATRHSQSRSSTGPVYPLDGIDSGMWGQLAGGGRLGACWTGDCAIAARHTGGHAAVCHINPRTDGIDLFGTRA